jgi:ankyrin repeat protein
MLDAQPDLLEAHERISSRPLLYEAAQKGQAEVVRVLLARGADVNRGNSQGRTPIQAAALGGREEVFIVLLRAGADIRWRENLNAGTTLMAACIQGHLGVTRLLLRHMRGEGLDDRAAGGKTAMWVVCCLRRAEICRALLLSGADHTIADDRGTTPRQKAQQEDDNPCMAVLEVGALSTSQTP